MQVLSNECANLPKAKHYPYKQSKQTAVTVEMLVEEDKHGIIENLGIPV